MADHHQPLLPRAASDAVSTATPLTTVALRWANLALLITIQVLNKYSSAGKIGHGAIGEISRRHPNFLVPAPWAFSIWGLIYAFLTLFALAQALFPIPAVDAAVGTVFLANALFSLSWLFLFSYEYIALSTFAIAGMWITALHIVMRLPRTSYVSWLEYLTYQLGLRLYAAWLTGATVVAIYAATTDRDAKYVPAAVVGAVAVAGLDAWIAVTYDDLVFVGVGFWTLVANYARNRGVPVLGPLVLVLAAGVGAVAAWIGWTRWTRRVAL
ncbi:hypothetical protein AMAG_17169 [Allomyces macrogynus ATCC 38327]|uniref:Tryptophan-rich sensory protein n=1 Tax=Allomyces macrogynus (strain ATCC 38327) TaxID=578462 RepID=A0A0L0TDX3_ALLM3|nr:hypothetical protein AMAG_17169 [Allomyces macrogynus ATCC 38327]|eukprot:KNE72937.1 hypothetical protein AMAG_17169 [Allomyces macrogynus ATCC 38327]